MARESSTLQAVDKKNGNKHSNQFKPEPPAYSSIESESPRGRQSYRSEYTPDSRLARSLSRGRRNPSQRSSVTPSRSLLVIQRRSTSPERQARTRPVSLNLDQCVRVDTLPDRPPSPAGSQASSSSTTSRASSRRSLVIVAPSKSVLTTERARIEEGTVSRRNRSVSATQELNVRAPSALKVKLTG